MVSTLHSQSDTEGENFEKVRAIAMELLDLHNQKETERIWNEQKQTDDVIDVVNGCIFVCVFFWFMYMLTWFMLAISF